MLTIPFKKNNFTSGLKRPLSLFSQRLIITVFLGILSTENSIRLPLLATHSHVLMVTLYSYLSKMLQPRGLDLKVGYQVFRLYFTLV